MPLVRDMFRSVTNSMFSLFEIFTCWYLMEFMPLFQVIPFIQPIFVLFYVFSAWMMLSVLTGVVSESLLTIRARAESEDSRVEVRERHAEQVREAVVLVLSRADTGDGAITRLELDTLLAQEEGLASVKEISTVAHE